VLREIDFLKKYLFDKFASVTFAFVENSYFNTDLCKLESSQKEESRAQSAALSKACQQTWSFTLLRTLGANIRKGKKRDTKRNKKVYQTDSEHLLQRMSTAAIIALSFYISSDSQTFSDRVYICESGTVTPCSRKT